MRFRIPTVYGILLTLLIGSSTTRADLLLGTYDGVVFGDLNAIGGDSEGRLLVGGNLVVDQSYAVGLNLPRSDSSRDDLIVGGNLTNNLSNYNFVVNANAVYAGTLTGGIIDHGFQGPSTLQISPVTIDTTTGNVDQNGAGISLSTLKSQYEALSSQLAGLASNGTIGGDPWNLYLNGTDSDLNVFNLGLADTERFTSTTVKITAPSSSTVIINLAGTAISNAGNSLQLDGIDQTHVIYNFYEATSFSSQSRQFNGSVLAIHAANATFTGGGSINGVGVFGGNLTQKGGFEFHNHPFDGTLPAAVPEPGSLILAGFGAATIALGLLGRKRWGRSAA